MLCCPLRSGRPRCGLCPPGPSRRSGRGHRRCRPLRPPRRGASRPSMCAHREAAAQFVRVLRFRAELPLGQSADVLERRSHECYLTDQSGKLFGQGRPAYSTPVPTPALSPEQHHQGHTRAKRLRHGRRPRGQADIAHRLARPSPTPRRAEADDRGAPTWPGRARGSSGR